MGSFWKKVSKWANPVTNNALTRAQDGQKMVMGDDDDDDGAARSEAADNQNPNKEQKRQAGGAQIDYYGTGKEGSTV